MNRQKILHALALSIFGDSVGANIIGMNREEIAKKYDFNSIEGFNNIIANIQPGQTIEEMPVIDIHNLAPVYNKEFRFSLDDCKQLHISYYSQLQLYIFEALMNSSSTLPEDLLKEIALAYDRWYDSQIEPLSNNETYLSLQPEMNELRCDNADLLELMEEKRYQGTSIEENVISLKEKIGEFFHKIIKNNTITTEKTVITIPESDSLFELVNAATIGLGCAIKGIPIKRTFVLAYKMSELTTKNKYTQLSVACLAFLVQKIYDQQESILESINELIELLNKIPDTDYFQSSLRIVQKEHIGAELTFRKDLENKINKFKTLKNADNVLILLVFIMITLEQYQIAVEDLIEVMVNGTEAKITNWDSRVLGGLSGFIYGIMKSDEKMSEQIKEVNVYTHVESIVEKFIELDQLKET